MQPPGWNNLESIRSTASLAADITVAFWIVMAVCEVSAVFFPNIRRLLLLLRLPAPIKRVRKLLAGIGLGALVFAVAGEAIVRKYEHRLEFLNDRRDQEMARNFQAQVDTAKKDAQAAKDENLAARRLASDATERADEADRLSVSAQKAVREAKEQVDELSKRQPPPPRRLSEAQLNELTKNCASYPTSIRIIYMENDEESFGLAKQVADAVTRAGWSLKAPISPAMIFSPARPLTGFIIGWKGDSVPEGQSVQLSTNTSWGALAVTMGKAFPHNLHVNPSPDADVVSLEILSNPKAHR